MMTSPAEALVLCQHNCTRRFTVITGPSGLGKLCPSLLSAPRCTRGDGACPRVPGGRAHAKRAALRQLLQAKQNASATALSSFRNQLQRRRSANNATTRTTRAAAALSLNETTALRLGLLSESTRILDLTRQQLIQSDRENAQQQALSNSQYNAHMQVIERAWRDSLSVVCNSTAGICDFDDSRNPHYPIRSRDTLYEHDISAPLSAAAGRRLGESSATAENSVVNFAARGANSKYLAENGPFTVAWRTRDVDAEVGTAREKVAAEDDRDDVTLRFVNKSHWEATHSLLLSADAAERKRMAERIVGL